MSPARKLTPPATRTKPSGRASTTRHIAAHRDPVGNQAARNVDKARDGLHRSLDRRG